MSSLESTGYRSLTQQGDERRGDGSKEMGMGGWKKESSKERM